MAGNQQKNTTGYCTTPEKEAGANAQSGQHNRGGRWNSRSDSSNMPQTPRQSDNPQGARRKEANPRSHSSTQNQPLQGYYTQPTQWTPQPSCSGTQNRSGAATASGHSYKQPRSLFDRYNEGKQTVGWRPEWKPTPSLDNPQQRSHYGSEHRRDSYSSDKMKRKEYGNKDHKEQLNQNVKRRSTLDSTIMVSPLEGLYEAEDTISKGRGYGVQRFRLSCSDESTKRPEVNKNKKEENWDDDSEDTDMTSPSKGSQEENSDEPDEAVTIDEDDKKTSPKNEDSPEGENWSKIDTVVSRNTGISFGFYQEIPKEDNDDNTGRRADEGWTPLEERRDTNRPSRIMSQDRSPKRNQRVDSPERSRSWNRFDRSASRRTGGNFGYYGNRSSRSNYDYNSRQNAREDWDAPEQFNTSYRHRSYNRGWNQYPRGRGTYRNNYNRNMPRRVADWDAPDETTDTGSETSSRMTENWDEPIETTVRDTDDKNTSPTADRDKQEENLASASKDNDKKDEKEDEEEAQRQRERDRNFAALMRYVDEDWGPPQWPSRSNVKTDSSSNSPKDLSSDDSKEKTSADPYDWITNRNTSDKKPEISRKSPDPIISKRSDSDEDSNTDESPQEEAKSTTENDNSVGSWETKWTTCRPSNQRKNTDDDEDHPGSHEGEGNSNGHNNNEENESNSQKGDSNTNDSNEENDSNSQKGDSNTNDSNEKETESVENLESFKERQTSTNTNAVKTDECAEKTEVTVLECNPTTSTSNKQTHTSDNDDKGGDQELTPATTVETKHGLKLVGSEALHFSPSSDEKEGCNETTEGRRDEGQSRGETSDDVGFDRMTQAVEPKAIASPKASTSQIYPTKKQGKRQKNFEKRKNYYSDDEEDVTDTDTSVEGPERYEVSNKTDLDSLRQDLRELAKNHKKMVKSRAKESAVSLDPESVARQFEHEIECVQGSCSLMPSDEDSDIEQEDDKTQPDTVTEPEYDSPGSSPEDGSIVESDSDNTDSDNEEIAKKRRERLGMIRTEMFFRSRGNAIFSRDDSDSDEMEFSEAKDSDPSTLYRKRKGQYRIVYRPKIPNRATKVTPHKRQKKVRVSGKELLKINRRSRVQFKKRVRKFRELACETARRNIVQRECQALKTINSNRLTSGQIKSNSSLNYWLKKSKTKYPFRLYKRMRENIIAPYKSVNSTPSRNRRKAAANVAEAASTDTVEDLESKLQEPGKKRSKYHAYSCRMCQLDTMVTLRDYLYHTTAHSEEYSDCPVDGCRVTSESNEEMRIHLTNHHPNYNLDIFEEMLDPLPNLLGRGPKYGFLCSKCTYVQALRRNVEFHAKRLHKEYEKIPIIRINLSEVLPDKPKFGEDNDDDLLIYDDETGSIPDRELEIQAEPRNEDPVLIANDDGERLEENETESEPRNNENSSRNSNTETEEQAVNENETASAINSSSSKKSQGDTNDEDEDQEIHKREERPSSHLKPVPERRDNTNSDSPSYLYVCIGKHCKYQTRNHNEFKEHTANAHPTKRRLLSDHSSDDEE